MMSSEKTKEKNGKSSFLSGAKTVAAADLCLRDQFGKYLEGNEGQPKRYKNREEIVNAGIVYLESLGDKRPTMAGLALSLGFRSRRSLVNYSSEDGYEFAFEAIQFLKLKIEEYLEERLLDHKNTNIAGLIFNLKNNFDWTDKQEIKMDQRTMQLVGFNFKRNQINGTDNT